MLIDRNSEAACLSIAFINEESLAMLMENAKAEYFTGDHRILFLAISKIYDKNEHFDEITLIGNIQKESLKYLVTEISGMTLSNSHFKHHLKIIRDLHKKRIIKKVANNLIRSLNNKDEDALSKAKQQIIDIDIEDDDHKTDYTSLEAVKKTNQRLNKLINGDIVGYGTGIIELDRHLLLQKGQMTVVSARSGVGKSAFVNQIMLHNSEQGKTIIKFMPEMTIEQDINRAISLRSGIKNEALQKGWVNMIDIEEYNKHSEQLAEENIIRIDDSSITPGQIHSKLTKYKHKFGSIDIVIIDYIQLLSGGTGDTRQQKLASLNRKIKALAKYFDVALINVCQLNKNYGIREAEDIFQDADTVVKLYRPAIDDYMVKDIQHEKKIKINGQWTIPEIGFTVCNIEKDRNGGQSIVYLNFDGDSQKFTE